MRRLTIAVVGAMAVGVTALPAWGAIDDNPHALELTDVECEGSISFESVWIPTAQAVTAHDPESKAGGVATSIYITDPSGNPLAPIFDRPGAGLDDVTVWCFWADAGSPTGFIGGDIILTGKRNP